MTLEQAIACISDRGVGRGMPKVVRIRKAPKVLQLASLASFLPCPAFFPLSQGP